MTPSETIIDASLTVESVTDGDGRRLTVKRLAALDRLRLFKAAGSSLAQNPPWLGMALIASSVTAIDDVPVPPPANETQIEAMIGRLGDTGIAAVAQVLQRSSQPASTDQLDSAGN